jgi:hypothetical protein
MPFYKRENEELHAAPNFVHGPGFSLTAETKDEHIYPVEGWYWFDTLDEAMVALLTVPTAQVVTIRQAKLALLQAELLDDVEAAMTQADRATQIEWEYATEFRRDWPALIAMQPPLGLTDTQIDDLFKLAATL